MIDCDLLLSWMTTAREGSWGMFRSAVAELAGSDADLSDLCRMLRIHFSDLGFADFFVEETPRWRVLPPVLGGLCFQDDAALLCGSRTPLLVQELKNIAEAQCCTIDVETPPYCPTLIRATGGMRQLAAIAMQLGMTFEPDLAALLAQNLTPVPDMFANAPEEPAPRNWKMRSFDFKTLTWTEGLIPNTACEYTPLYGSSKYFVHGRDGQPRRLGKGASLYVAAMLNGIELIQYSSTDNSLQVPLFAPLPESYARAACLSAGAVAQVAKDQLVYSGMPPQLAAMLMVAAGQRYPEMTFSFRLGG